MSEVSSTDNDNLQKRRESMSVPVLSVEFDGGTHVIIRPNRVIRGNNRMISWLLASDINLIR